MTHPMPVKRGHLARRGLQCLLLRERKGDERDRKPPEALWTVMVYLILLRR